MFADPRRPETRRGILMLLQVAELLLPHIEAVELPLKGTIVVQIQPDVSIANLISGDAGHTH